MTIFNLVPFAAELHLGAAASASRVTASSSSLRMEARLTPDSEIHLSGGSSLKDAPWVIFISEAASYNERATAQGAIGVLQYWAHEYEADQGALSLALSSDRFSTLLSALQLGLLPTLIFVETVETECFERDGSGIAWNVDPKRNVAIAGVTFTIPLVETRHQVPFNPGTARSFSARAPVEVQDRSVLSQLTEWGSAAARLAWPIIALVVFVIAVMKGLGNR